MNLGEVINGDAKDPHAAAKELAKQTTPTSKKRKRVKKEEVRSCDERSDELQIRQLRD